MLRDRDGSLECEVLTFLRTSEFTSSARGFPPLFHTYADTGRLSTEVFHFANQQKGIREFIKGRLRIFCFADDDRNRLILTHGAVKKSRKADDQEVAKAARIKNAYFEAATKNDIQIIEGKKK